jgi:hypothetical protein
MQVMFIGSKFGSDLSERTRLMAYRIVNTDNFGGDYPVESFVDGKWATEEEAQKKADLMNGPYPEHSARYYKVVEMPYELETGFEA